LKTDPRPARRQLLAALLAGPTLAFAQAGSLPAASDLHAETERTARSGEPLIVLFSRRDCRHCETVRRDYLKPLAATGQAIRQVNQDSDAPLTGFHGEATTHARLAGSEKIKLVPVVAFYGPDGRRLAEPIVGTRLADFYQSYLDRALEQARLALKKP